MKPGLPKEDRDFSQAQRGLAAQRIKEDELIQAWFDAEETRITREMLSTEISEDEKRRNCLLEIRTLRKLRSYIDTQASLGKPALKAMEAKNA